jgi:TfoX/Sxy family transcriptional regulator of competence genes
MEMPKPDPAAERQFEQLRPDQPNVTSRKVFGHPAAFVNGNMFFGVFGPELFVRLSDRDSVAAASVPGFRPFEPMPGRPMRGYLVLPTAVRAKPVEARRWIRRSLEFASGLPPKKAKPRSK